MTHPAFSFETEFTSDGAILSGPQRTYVSLEEAGQTAARARSEGETSARQSAESRTAAAVDRILAQLAPAHEQIARLADELRREAAELAMIAARKIAGDALDARAVETATAGVAEALRLLKGSPVVRVSVAADALAEVQHRLEQNRQRGALAIEFVADPQAQPGDWRVEWNEGVAAFRREDVEAAISAVVAERLSDPVEPQLDLFNAA